MSLSWPFDFIKDLNDSKHLWKIAVRITQIWYVQIPPKPGHLEMILMDSKGDKIQVSVRKDEFNQWNQCLLENNIYVMHNFNVMKNDLQYKACDHRHPIWEFPFRIANSGDVISCTLWETHAMKFFNYFNNQSIVQPLIILLTNARVKEGHGDVTNTSNYSPTVSNSWFGSKLLIDEEITNIQKYKDRFVNIA
ncbi:hypothetical protein Lal_00044789 [Lupinus albus]|nr:hypothetical protein Lal_00044789 [Lupinus albus]